MKTSGNTVLVTGGSTGIGFALADVLVREGNEVIVCGRREHKLTEAKEKVPAIHTRVCNIADRDGRRALVDWVTGEFGDFNILVNNAGIQREIDFKKGEADLTGQGNEVETNFLAPVHLSALCIPHLMKKPEAGIVNISSGLGFVPIAIMPVYCATKAALHSFSWTLRHQLRGTSIKVFEIIPPTVDTELDQGARAKRGERDRGIMPAEVAEATLRALQQDQFELAVGRAQDLCAGARNDPERVFQMMNNR